MWWPWRRRPHPPCPTPPDGDPKAERAQATARFMEAIEHDREVREMADRLRERRRRNHFGPDLEKAMRLRDD